MDGFLDRYMNFVQISCFAAILFEIVGIILAGFGNGFGNLIGRYLILVPAIVMAVLAGILAIAILIKELFFDRIH